MGGMEISKRFHELVPGRARIEPSFMRWAPEGSTRSTSGGSAGIDGPRSSCSSFQQTPITMIAKPHIAASAARCVSNCARIAAEKIAEKCASRTERIEAELLVRVVRTGHEEAAAKDARVARQRARRPQ